MSGFLSFCNALCPGDVRCSFPSPGTLRVDCCSYAEPSLGGAAMAPWLRAVCAIVAAACDGEEGAPAAAIVGIEIWASVDPLYRARARGWLSGPTEQLRAAVADWTSGVSPRVPCRAAPPALKHLVLGKAACMLVLREDVRRAWCHFLAPALQTVRIVAPSETVTAACAAGLGSLVADAAARGRLTSLSLDSDVAALYETLGRDVAALPDLECLSVHIAGCCPVAPAFVDLAVRKCPQVGFFSLQLRSTHGAEDLVRAMAESSRALLSAGRHRLGLAGPHFPAPAAPRYFHLELLRIGGGEDAAANLAAVCNARAGADLVTLRLQEPPSAAFAHALGRALRLDGRHRAQWTVHGFKPEDAAATLLPALARAPLELLRLECAPSCLQPREAFDALAVAVPVTAAVHTLVFEVDLGLDVDAVVDSDDPEGTIDLLLERRPTHAMLRRARSSLARIEAFRAQCARARRSWDVVLTQILEHQERRAHGQARAAAQPSLMAHVPASVLRSIGAMLGAPDARALQVKLRVV